MYVVMKIMVWGYRELIWQKYYENIHVKVYEKSVKVEIKPENFKIIFVWVQKHILYLNKVGWVQNRSKANRSNSIVECSIKLGYHSWVRLGKIRLG
jgi:hypothetical protein